ncbi:MAG: hypothetical protein N838_20890 [Thiohalocapsa sp. PB-PSB1]|jgi:exodeoxyribonuclease VII large subunit|nr:MAG: hypothetical protein N838_20890 [Thiohalocapsa sp. PB-PSB1]
MMTDSANSFTAGTDTLVDFSRDLWSVSRLNLEVRTVLDGSFPLLWVQGELSNLSQPASGHLYFTLKDEAAQVRCALFRFKRRLMRFRPSNGDRVLIRARVGLYEARGDFQLIVEHMEPAGEGALRVELERLKQQLAAEGLFDEARKRPLPEFPLQVGLITSTSGAALHDLLTVLRRRLPLLPVLIYPVQVQGEDAVSTLVDALARANHRGDCDLLILARGGGSLEDLMAFNDERLVRAIAASDTPIITGIGHEVDISLADLAADRRGATPSAAAELASPSVSDIRQQLQVLQQRLITAQRICKIRASRRVESAARHLRMLHPLSRLQSRAQALDRIELRMAVVMRYRLQGNASRTRNIRGRLVRVSPRARVLIDANTLKSLAQRLATSAARNLSIRQKRLAAAAGRLDALSPLAILARGFSVVSLLPEGTIVRDARLVPSGSHIRVRPQHGTLIATVDSVESQPQ